MSAVVLTAGGAQKAMVFLLAMGVAAAIAWRVFLTGPAHEKPEQTEEPAEEGEDGHE